MRRKTSWCIAGVLLLGATSSSALAQRLPKPPINKPAPYVSYGRYRVTISGFATAKETVDRDDNTYGQKDEVYAAAAFVLWDRRDGRMLSTPNVVRSREYGEALPNAGRIRAGSATPNGGLWGGNNGDYVPLNSDPRAAVGPAPLADQFPLMIFEGNLSDGVEALLIAPSLWESDGRPTPFNNYANNWRTGGIAKVLNSPAVQNQVLNANLTSAVIPGDPTTQTISQIANIFSGGIIGSYIIGASTIITSLLDRPIGLAPYQNGDQYQDRVVVVTREKLLSLMPGSGVTLAVPFWEPADGQLNGLYTAYVRVERIQ